MPSPGIKKGEAFLDFALQKLLTHKNPTMTQCYAHLRYHPRNHYRYQKFS
jgi:hypothetical protein